MKKTSYKLLLLFIILFPLWEGISIDYNIVGPSILGLLLIGIWILESFQNNIYIDTWATILFTLLFTVFLFASYFSPDIIFAIKKVISLLSVVLLFILIVDLLTRGNSPNYMLIAYVFGMFLFSLSMIYNIINSIGYLGLYNRFSAIGTGPNNFAIMLATTIPILLYLTENLEKKYKIFSISTLILFSILIISTASRSGVIALILVLVLYLVPYIKLNFKSLVFIVLFILFSGVIINSSLIEIIPTEALERLISASNSNTDTESGGRLYLWKIGLESIFDNSFFGIGIGSFLDINSLQIHNTFLYFYLSAGIFAFIAWVVIWIIQLKYIIYLIRNKHLLGYTLFLTYIPLLLGANTLNWEMRKPIFIIFGVITASKLLMEYKKIKIKEN